MAMLLNPCDALLFCNLGTWDLSMVGGMGSIDSDSDRVSAAASIGGGKGLNNGSSFLKLCKASRFGLDSGSSFLAFL